MDEVQPIRVMLVDDQAMVRLGLATMLRLSNGLILAGEADDGDAAITLCEQLRPDVVLMDLLMPGMDGITAIRAIHHFYPHVKVIVVSGSDDEKEIKESFEAGAAGYLLKDVTAEELAAAIRVVMAGLDVLSPRVLKRLLHEVGPQAAKQETLLTAREKEVLSLMIEGFGNTKIADQLVVEPATVKTHVSSILSKLKVSSRTEAVTQALRQQLIS